MSPEELIQILYQEIHRNAHQQRLKFNSNLTLNTTAIVHEAYIKVAENTGLSVRDRLHFLKIMSKAIRWVLLDDAKRNNAQKRAVRKNSVNIDEVENKLFLDNDVLFVDELLIQLEEKDPELAEIVELRFYGSATNQEAAQILGLSESTVKRRWNFAKAWLFTQLSESL
jgi:RNA polymerase sigma factor (TIGR02999 family)